MLHLRWDYTFVQHNMPTDKKFGVYKIHGHKNEIQMVNYGSKPEFSFWDFKIEGDSLIFISKDKKSTIKLSRIHQYLQ